MPLPPRKRTRKYGFKRASRSLGCPTVLHPRATYRDGCPLASLGRSGLQLQRLAPLRRRPAALRGARHRDTPWRDCPNESILARVGPPPGDHRGDGRSFIGCRYCSGGVCLAEQTVPRQRHRVRGALGSSQHTECSIGPAGEQVELSASRRRPAASPTRLSALADDALRSRPIVVQRRAGTP